MTKVLFVDDEEMILKGLRRMLHSSCKEWTVAFAIGGQKALDQMAEAPFDVVVSDMRMPGMNGNELLAEVKRRYPSMVRIILSGHADLDLILESTRHAHRYLSKPCQARELKETIGRCCQLRALLDDKELVGIVSNLSSIPSLPMLYLDVVRTMEDETKGLRDVGDVIAQDVGMTAKVLQLVNSAFFGLPRHISSMGDAVSFLGTQTLKSLVLSVKLFSEFTDSDLGGLSAERIAAHNMRCGVLAQRLAKDVGAPAEVCDNALLAGNLHDIGKLILAINMPEAYAQVQQLMIEQGMDHSQAELQAIGSTHAQVGAYLLSLWGLPQPIVEAIAFHHQPDLCPTREFTPLTAVYLANALDRWPSPAEGQGELSGALDMEYLTAVGIDERVPDWISDCEASKSEGVE